MKTSVEVRTQFIPPRLFRAPSVRNTVMARDALTDQQYDLMLEQFDALLDDGMEPELALREVFDLGSDYINDREICKGHPAWKFSKQPEVLLLEQDNTLDVEYVNPAHDNDHTDEDHPAD